MAGRKENEAAVEREGRKIERGEREREIKKPRCRVRGSKRKVRRRWFVGGEAQV